MRLKNSTAFLLGLTLLFAQMPVFAQKKQPRPATPSVEEDNEAAEQKRLLLYRLKSIADSLGSLNDVALKGQSWARLADLTWPVDQSYAKLLFRKALDASESPTMDKKEQQRLLIYK